MCDHEKTEFEEAIDYIQDILSDYIAKNKLHELIELRNKDHIHATLIGMESEKCQSETGEKIINKNQKDRSKTEGGEPQPYDLGEIVRYFKAVPFPIKIRIGGINKKIVNPFDLDRPPFKRTFSIRPNGQMVVIGFPVDFQPLLAGIRTGFEKVNIVHKYHIKRRGVATPFDNDAFIVVGDVTTEYKYLNKIENDNFCKILEEIKLQIRNQLAKNQYRFQISQYDCMLFPYKKTTLEEQIMKEVPISKLTPNNLQKLLIACL
ncbi:MAG: hypothetical protein JW779_03670 [Candidatus Thorarchaeota archaeon]|nr:hypothetical protein [Candidatus Thorarchaeota archaeon]